MTEMTNRDGKAPALVLRKSAMVLVLEKNEERRRSIRRRRRRRKLIERDNKGFHA